MGAFDEPATLGAEPAAAAAAAAKTSASLLRSAQLSAGPVLMLRLLGPAGKTPVDRRDDVAAATRQAITIIGCLR